MRHGYRDATADTCFIQKIHGVLCPELLNYLCQKVSMVHEKENANFMRQRNILYILCLPICEFHANVQPFLKSRILPGTNSDNGANWSLCVDCEFEIFYRNIDGSKGG